MTTIPESRALSSIGGSLRQARVAAGCDLERVAEGLGIRVTYLEALEAGGLDRILGPAYVESMIVRYAMYLGLDPEEFLLSVAQNGGAPSNGTPSNGTPSNGTPSNGTPSNGGRPDRFAAPASPPSVPRPLPGAGPAATVSVHRASGSRRSARRVASPEASTARSRTRLRPRVIRIGVLAALVVALVAVGIFGGLELDLFSLFGGGDSAVVDQSGTLAAAATPASGAADGETVAAPTTTATESTTGSAADSPTTTTAASDSGGTSSGDATPGVIVATTTTLGGSQADPSTAGLHDIADAGGPAGAGATGAFTFKITASDEAWVEVRDAESGTALHLGAIAKGASVSLEADGPLNVVAGKPEVLAVKIDGRAVKTPIAFRWVVTATGVEERS